MVRVFLDQSRWIELARVATGRQQDEGVQRSLDMLREGVRQGLVSVPVTSAHYIETNRRRDPDQRRRLGRVMSELSRGHTMTGICTVATWEIETAVHEHLGGPRPSTMPRVFGLGAAHAFGRDDLHINVPFVDELDPGVRSAVRTMIDREVERELLGGPPFEVPAHGIARPDKAIAERWAESRNKRQANFREWGVSGDRAWRIAVAEEYNDILDMLVPVLDKAGLDLSVLTGAGAEAMTDFLGRIPTAYSMACLEHSAMCNESFRWEANDFHDLTMTSLASVYCDVVVGETKWVNLLRASRARPHALVTKDLADLPTLLVTAA